MYDGTISTKSMMLKANPNYFKGRPQIDEVQINLYTCWTEYVICF